MIKASIDLPRLQRSLKRFAKEFGDTNAQAITRWGVQACRELAGSTQVFGRSAAAKKKQWNSIEAGTNTVFNVVPNSSKRSSKMMRTVEDASDWIDSCRTVSRGRTRKVPASERPYITEDLLLKTLRYRYNLAGIAKGGWIGAGQDIARSQRGTDRISIGKNFLGYAQKHSAFGSSRVPRSGWSPTAIISNTARHTAKNHVLAPSEAKQSIGWGLKKTITWYRSALKRQNQSQKP